MWDHRGEKEAESGERERRNEDRGEKLAEKKRVEEEQQRDRQQQMDKLKRTVKFNS